MEFGGGGERVEILDRVVGNGLTGKVASERNSESRGIASQPGTRGRKPGRGSSKRKGRAAP